MFDLKSIFGSLGKTEDGSVLGLDIGSSAIKLVQLKRQKGQAVLETYGEISLAPYNSQEIGKATNLPIDKIVVALKDLMTASNVTARQAVMSMPISSSFISFITLPNVDDAKLKDIIPFEAKRQIHIPFSSEEMTIDYWIVPKEENVVSEFQTAEEMNKAQTSKEALVVLVNNEFSAKNKEIANQAGLQLGFSEIEIFSNMHSVIEQSISPQMVIDFGASITKIFIVDRGMLRVSHMINRGSQEISLAISHSLGIPFDTAESLKREKGIETDERGLDKIGLTILEYIFSEARRSILEYQKKTNKNVGKIYITGGGANLKGLIRLMEENFQLPVEIAAPFAKIKYPEFLEDVLKTVGPEFSVAVGLAIRKMEESE